MTDSDVNRIKTVSQAIVRVGEPDGHGVLVPGDIILTAAHCVKWKPYWARDWEEDPTIVKVKTATDQTLKVTSIAVEPVCDVAALGALDYETFFEEFEAFDQYCQNTMPATLATNELDLFKPIRVFVWTNDEKWSEAEVQQCQQNAKMLMFHGELEAGMSGGPVVDESGRLLGLVSMAFNPSPIGAIIRPLRVLPVWVVEIIQSATATTRFSENRTAE